MTTETQVPRKGGSKLKMSSGWFAAGVSFQRAMTMLSDGAFKLFAYVSLQADRGTGRYEASQTDLARVLGKSRRIIGRYMADLEGAGICAISSGRNQYARNNFEILEDYWPYHRLTVSDETKRKEEDAYVATVRDKFLATGCTRGRFSLGDERTARAMKEQGVSLERVQEALLLGACRKYDSWLRGGSPEPIASLRYFESLLSEIHDQPLPQGYREYLQSKISQLARMWEETKVAGRRAINRRNLPLDK